MTLLTKQLMPQLLKHTVKTILHGSHNARATAE
ncbi:hypothetical protein O982_24235 [Mycobacterium avium 10-5581]|nr:hypothetical protein O982_24235 [Mycobacterium avium 10-5581]